MEAILGKGGEVNIAFYPGAGRHAHTQHGTRATLRTLHAARRHMLQMFYER